ncbi:hypothetical protein ACN4EG_22165 [Alkalinema pantanalense CENA528]|uniref:hypothetical protein n=1 Tax=Alkalinema pantanalense TaxID=1620705 RepID=UPI003D6F157D
MQFYYVEQPGHGAGRVGGDGFGVELEDHWGAIDHRKGRQDDCTRATRVQHESDYRESYYRENC